MKKLFFFCGIVLSIVSASLPASAQQTFKTTPSSVIGFLEYLPADYHSNSNKYPVVIFLHGLGERGTNTTDPAVLETSIATVTKHGPPKHVKNGTSFPFILISPQLKNNFGNWPSWYVMEVIDYVKTYLRIDERRIHITGLSLGGGGTWVMTQDYTKMFATSAPVCGSTNSLSKACNIATENLPLWAFHGDADPTVPLSRSVNMVNAINACVPAPSPSAIMTIYPGVKHNAWDKAYWPDNTYHKPNIYEWMMSYTNTINAGNRIPVANAGSDRTITLPTSSLTLTATATDADGTISAYRWAQVGGAAGTTLTNATAATVTVSGLKEGTYMFRVQVTDNKGDTDSDYVRVTVQKATSTVVNVAPVANAGADRLVNLPSTSVTITGTGSDADGTISSYAWTKVSGGAATLTGATTSKLVVTSFTNGTYVFRLTVRDNAGATHSDDMVMTVNHAPVVNAGPDVSVSLPKNSVTLVGSATDADGTIASYTWAQRSGPSTATLSGKTTSTLTASNLIEGTYVYRMSAKDNSGCSRYDEVIVTVKAGVIATSRVSDTQIVSNEEIDGLLLEDERDAEDPTSWTDKMVIIYNDRGQKIFNGRWTQESYEQVFSQRGLYIYNVYDNGIKPQQGKLFIN